MQDLIFSKEAKDGVKLYVYLLFSISVIVVDGEMRELLLDIGEVWRAESDRDVRQGREDLPSIAQKIGTHVSETQIKMKKHVSYTKDPCNSIMSCQCLDGLGNKLSKILSFGLE